MSLPFLTVISSVYNAQKYLDAGIKSVLNQSFVDFEYFLIDDGSTDNSLEICERYASQDSRITVLSQEHKGPGPARNLALKQAQGKWILFFDVDDGIVPNAFEVIDSHLKDKDSLDLLVYSFDIHFLGTNRHIPRVYPDMQIRGRKEVEANYVEHWLGINGWTGYLWNKAYSRDFLTRNNLLIPSVIIQEDDVFNINVFKCVENVDMISDRLYNYYSMPQGNSRAHYIPDLYDVVNTVKLAFLDICDTWGLTDQRMPAYVYNRFFFEVVSCIRQLVIFPNNLSWAEKRKEVGEILNRPETRECIKMLEELNAVPASGMAKLYFAPVKARSVTRVLLLSRIIKVAKACKDFINRMRYHQ